jgi:hypothetical protein
LILKQIIGYDIYDRFTIEHFPFCQRMILTTSFTVHTVESRMQNILIVNVTKKLFVMFMSELCNLHCVRLIVIKKSKII